MQKKQILLISIIVLINVSIKAQINPATARRDWFVGHYVGTLKDSVPNIVINCSMNVIYTGSDSTVFIPIGGLSGVVCIDSTLGNDRFCSNWPFNYVQYGKINVDSSAVFCMYSMGGCACTYSTGGFCQPGRSMIFRGKKVSDIPLNVNEAELEANNIAIFPNPVTNNYFSILTLVEPDEFVLYDILGKSHSIAFNKIDNGYKIKLLNSISSGIYFLNLHKGGNMITKKIVIRIEN